LHAVAVAAALVLPGDPAAAAPEAAPESAPGSDAPATAVIAFVAYRGAPTHDLHPTWVRRTASSVLADALAESGRRVVTGPDLESVLQARRIRSNRDVDAALVDEVAGRHAADRIVVATLTLHRDRLHLLARGLRPGTGTVAWADAVEEILPAGEPEDPETDRARFREILVRAAAALRIDWSVPTDPRGTLVVLPVRAEGTDHGLTDLVSSSLFRALLAHGDWNLPDPALTESAVRSEGLHPLQLQAASRRLLAERFEARWLVVPRLLPFPIPGAGLAPIAAEDDEPSRPPFELGERTPFHLSLTLIECTSGKVIEGAAEYLVPDSGIGMFGVTRRPPSVQRFERGVGRAVSSLFGDGGGNP